MTFTTAERNFAQNIFLEGGGRLSPTTLSFLMKRRFRKSFSKKDLTDLISTFSFNKPEVRVKDMPPVRTLTRKKIREEALSLIKEIEYSTDFESLEKTRPLLSDEGVSPMLLLSDLHFGEVIEFNGKELFNFDIAEQRLSDIVDQALTDPGLDSYDIDEFIVVLAGDIIDGELIFPAQAHETETSIWGQLKRATAVIWQQLVKISREHKVRVFCVPGNHGRTSKLHDQMSNWDNALYFSLRMMSSLSDANIEITLPHQLWMDFSVRQWGVHTRHIGPAHVSTPSPIRKVMSWMDNHNADLFLYGHYHNPEMFSYGYRRIFKNGSLPTVSEFAERLGFENSVGQWLIVVSDNSPVEFSKVIIPYV